MSTFHPARVVGAAGLSAALLLSTAAAASAHVRVIPESTAAGGYAVLNFRVPNEQEQAGTTKVTITLPQDQPFTSVSARPLPGWAITTTSAKLPKPITHDGATLTEAVRTVTWTADKSSAIAPHQFQVFSLSVGTLPDEGKTVLLPADQTYSNGQVVRWNQPSSGGSEPEHPAPEFVVTAAESEHAGSTGAKNAAGHDAQAASPAAARDSSDGTARWLGGAGLALGLIALVVAGGVLGRSRRTKGI